MLFVFDLQRLVSIHSFSGFHGTCKLKFSVFSSLKHKNTSLISDFGFDAKIISVNKCGISITNCKCKCI